MSREEFLTKRLAERGEELEQAREEIERLQALLRRHLREHDMSATARLETETRAALKDTKP
jgi:hypothetical protein